MHSVKVMLAVIFNFISYQIESGKFKYLSTCIRGDHFEIKFIENCYKFEIFLVKIGTYGLPKPFVGPTSPQVPALLPT